MEKRYLGDGVYAEFDSAALAVILTTEDGISVTNRIVLEPEVLDALGTFAKAAIYERQRPPLDGRAADEKRRQQLAETTALVDDHDPAGKVIERQDGELSIEVVKAAGLTIYPCGCSHLKVKAGLCSIYAADGTERSE